MMRKRGWFTQGWNVFLSAYAMSLIPCFNLIVWSKDKGQDSVKLYTENMFIMWMNAWLSGVIEVHSMLWGGKQIQFSQYFSWRSSGRLSNMPKFHKPKWQTPVFWFLG